MILITTRPHVMEAFKPKIVSIFESIGVGSEYNNFIMLGFKALTVAAAKQAVLNIRTDNTPYEISKLTYENTLKGIVPTAAGLLMKFYIRERFGDSFSMIIAAGLCKTLAVTSISAVCNSSYGYPSKVTQRKFINGLVSELMIEAAGACVSYGFKPESFAKEVVHGSLKTGITEVADYYTNLTIHIANICIGNTTRI